jgi:hypothetical protein
MEQIELFDKTAERPEITTRIPVVRNWKREYLFFDELFSDEFTHLHAITYVASPTFFLKHTQKYKEVHLILGINNPDHHQEMLNHIADIESRISLWKSLTPEQQERFQNEQYSIRFPRHKEVVHSKIYLLSNPETGGKRVIVGSANFSHNAFIKPKQYEEIIVEDSEQAYDTFMERFQEIKERSIDYILPQLKKKNSKEIIDARGNTELGVALFKEALEQQKEIKVILTPTDLEEVKMQAKEKQKQAEQLETTLQVLEKVTRKVPKKEERTWITADTTVKKTVEIIVDERYKKVQDHDPRPHWTMSQERLYEKQGEESYLLSKPASLDKIREGIELIEEFAESYVHFSVSKNDLRGKVMESLMYAFLSPHLWKIRDLVAEYDSNAAKRDIRPILILSGQSRSGKSTIAEIAADFMGNRRTNKLIPYSKFSRATSLQPYFYTGIVSPLLVDEIKPSFFTGAAGGGLVREVANELSGPHPCLIGATNTENITAEPAVANRIYLLHFNNPFDPALKTESRRFLNDLRSRITPDLFYDFTERMANKIHEEQEKIVDLDDFLRPAREIFLSYYEELGREVPEFFPRQLFNDYYTEGAKVWKELYQQQPDWFPENKDGFISVAPEIFKETKKSIIDYLPTEVVELYNEPILLLRKEQFLKYIGIEKKKRIWNWFK